MKSKKSNAKKLKFSSLVKQIKVTNSDLQQRALRSVNQILVVRNWLIGRHILGTQFETYRIPQTLSAKSNNRTIPQGDNPPIGIILCTEKDSIKVKYATVGISNKVFVSKYKIELPTESELEKLIQNDPVLIDFQVNKNQKKSKNSRRKK